MAKAREQYVVIHPVRHEGVYHRRGSVIELGEDDALRLLGKGVIKTADVVVVRVSAVPVVLGASTLAKLNVAELVEYGRTTHSLDATRLTGLTKDEILSEIAQSAVKAGEVAEAEAEAEENGRL
jgi:hypothetical protein